MQSPALSRFASCSATTYHSTFPEDVENCTELGIPGLGVWEYKLRNDHEKDVDLFKESGMTATFCFPDVPGVIYGDILFSEPRDRTERLAGLLSGIRRLARFDPVGISVLAGSQRDADFSEAWSWSVEGLREAAYLAGELGCQLLLEVIRSSPRGAIVNTIPLALEMIAEIGLDNVRVLIDTFHSFDSPEFIRDIKANTAHIGGVQVNDHPPQSAGYWDRALPGDGDMDLSSILRALEESGYQGWYELELFSDDGTWGHAVDGSLWQKPPLDVLRAGRDGFGDVWAKTFG